MKIAVFSDSHGEIENLKEAAKTAVRESADILIHLGDNYEDAAVLDGFGKKVIKVPGVFSGFYKDPGIPNRVVETIAGRKILISHTETSHPNDISGDLKPEEVISGGEVDFAFVGHTHIPKIERRGKVTVVNPGHLKSGDKRGFSPSFAVIDFSNGKIRIFDLKTGEVIRVHR
ncbi:MAG: YfcE family phosphodiesterase [bacterium]